MAQYRTKKFKDSYCQASEIQTPTPSTADTQSSPEKNPSGPLPLCSVQPQEAPAWKSCESPNTLSAY